MYLCAGNNAKLKVMYKLNNYQKSQKENIFKGNPSLSSDMIIGWYGNGDAVIRVFWEGVENIIYAVTLHKKR